MFYIAIPSPPKYTWCCSGSWEHPSSLSPHHRAEREKTTLSSELNDARSAADLMSNEKVNTTHHAHADDNNTNASNGCLKTLYLPLSFTSIPLYPRMAQVLPEMRDV